MPINHTSNVEKYIGVMTKSIYRFVIFSYSISEYFNPLWLIGYIIPLSAHHKFTKQLSLRSGVANLLAL